MSEDPKLASIDRQHQRLAKLDHFELLGVEPETPDEVVKGQWVRLLRQWHSDAFPGLELGERKAKLDEIVQRINEAYETLTDPTRRAEYMTLLERKRAGLSTDVNSILRAESLVDDGLQALRQKRWKDAVNLFAEARGLNPDDPLYAVHEAWALYNADTRKNADSAVRMLKDAVKAQESLATGYQHLGQIHFNLGQYDMAMRWWKKCLEWEPKNVEASRGLRLANTRKAKEAKKSWLTKLLGR